MPAPEAKLVFFFCNVKGPRAYSGPCLTSTMKLKPVNYSHKKLHLTCLTGCCISRCGHTNIHDKITKMQMTLYSCTFEAPRSLQLTLENSNTRFLELFDSSNKLFGPLNIAHFFRQKNSRYLEYLGRSNKIVGPLDDFRSFSRTFVLPFRPKFESSIKFERFIRFFG